MNLTDRGTGPQRRYISASSALPPRSLTEGQRDELCFPCRNEEFLFLSYLRSIVHVPHLYRKCVRTVAGLAQVIVRHNEVISKM